MLLRGGNSRCEYRGEDESSEAQPNTASAGSQTLRIARVGQEFCRPQPPASNLRRLPGRAEFYEFSEDHHFPAVAQLPATLSRNVTGSSGHPSFASTSL